MELRGGLGADQRAAFAENGLLFPLAVLGGGETRRYRAACDRLEAQLGGRPRTVEVRQMHLHFRWAYDLATTPAIVDAAAAVLGENLLIWATELFAKHPRDPSVVIAWHRDKDYTGFDAPHAVTAWIALSPCDEANGCLKAYPGPRRLTQPQPDALSGGAVCVALRPGEMSLHDGDLLHGSGPNLSGEKRVGFAIRYVKPEARARHGRPTAVLARGRDGYGHFQLVSAPPEVPEAEALGHLRRSAAEHFDALLTNLADRATGKE